MGAPQRVFVPFGALNPDSGELRNSNLNEALNVVPIADTYVPAGSWKAMTSALAAPPLGWHVHPQADLSGGWNGYFGTATKLYEVSGTDSASAWTVTDKSRAAGGAYAAVSDPGWNGATFGGAIVMTNYVDDPQLLLTTGTANFAKLAQSGGANPGMDPKAKFVFPVRNNLFLANLSLSAGFDGLPSGANPYTVCWSQTDNIRQYGSFNVTPQLTGTGYQQLTYDLGNITGAVGGQYGIIFFQRGAVRVDGPPYTFRPISLGVGCLEPHSIVRFDDDVYFWSPSGPAVFRGGEGPAVPIALGTLTRTLNDFTFGEQYGSYVSFGSVSGAVDILNRQVWWTYNNSTTLLDNGDYAFGNTVLVLNVPDERWSFVHPTLEGSGGNVLGPVFMDTAPKQVAPISFVNFSGTWTPGRDIVAPINYPTSIGLGLFTQTYVIGTPIQTDSAIACRFRTGFMQLSPSNATRIRRIRPVCSGAPSSMSLYINTRANPAATADTSATFTGMDKHHWITTPSAKTADFHQVVVTINAVPSAVFEIEGLEVEFDAAGQYAA